MADIVKTFIIKYDDTAAFGNCLFRIKQPVLRDGFTLSRLAVQIGPLTKVYSGNALSFPIDVQLSREESNKLHHENPVDVLLYDGDGKAETAFMKKRYIVIAGERKVYDYGESD